MAKISKKDYVTLMRSLYRERPEHKGVIGLEHGLNPKQRELITAYKDPNITTMFCPWGRKCGKTHSVLHIAWEHAILNPGSSILYVAPTRSDAENIIWKGRRVQDFLGKEAAKHFTKGMPNNRDLVIRLNNNSYIQLMGSERYENANGLSPDLIIYDEFKAFHPEFHRTMSMNSAAKGAKLIIIGTKADYMSRNRTEYNAMMKIADKNSSQKLINGTTFDNPMNMRPNIHKRIMDDIEALRAAGREEVVQREYYNKIIPGGSNAIFPEVNTKRHVMKHDLLMQEVNKQYNELQFYQVIDPATSSVFGGLFIAYNAYSGKVYVLDEIYEKDLKDVAIGKIFPRIKAKADEFTKGEDFGSIWYPVYDEAAAWAANEILDQFDISYIPTDKNNISKEGGISIIKHLLNKDLIILSDRCVNLLEELLGYKRNKNGVIPKIGDHNIDCLRYFVQAANYTVKLVKRAHAAIKPQYKYTDRLDDYLNSESIFSDELDMDIDFSIDID